MVDWRLRVSASILLPIVQLFVFFDIIDPDPFEFFDTTDPQPLPGPRLRFDPTEPSSTQTTPAEPFAGAPLIVFVVGALIMAIVAIILIALVMKRRR
jgi:hypothetical protein